MKIEFEIDDKVLQQGIVRAIEDSERRFIRLRREVDIYRRLATIAKSRRDESLVFCARHLSKEQRLELREEFKRSETETEEERKLQEELMYGCT